MVADRKADVVSNYCARSRGQHDANEIELIRSAGGEVAANEQDCFARNEKTRVLEHDTKENGPISVREHVLLNEW